MKNNYICPICEAKLTELDEIYFKCESCGLNIKKELKSDEITNDHLDYQEIIKRDGLTKFKMKLVKSLDPKRIGLLDIGTASGKFLHHARNEFDNVQGIEVNQACITFAREKLQLKLVPSLSEIDFSHVSCVTFWHSLEHIPLELSRKILDDLKKLPVDAKLVISVPNSKSWQFKIFKHLWPYYDKSSHLYQFSPDALNLFMKSNGYKLRLKKIGLMYELFGYLQGFVNLVHPIPNYFYYRKKRGWDFHLTKPKLIAYDIYNYFLLIVFLPISALACLLSLLKNEGVINYIYERNL